MHNMSICLTFRPSHTVLKFMREIVIPGDAADLIHVVSFRRALYTALHTHLYLI